MTPCPACGEELDGATEVTNDGRAVPRPGDLSMCWYCGAILTFDDDTMLRLATDADMTNLPPGVAEIITNMSAIQRDKRGRTPWDLAGSGG
jgi:hypothetical protein